jgi:hypothetical protein
MALTAKAKQKKIAKKANKRKAKLKDKQTNKLSNAEKMQQKILNAQEAPIHQCFVPEDLFEVGMGNLVMSRKLSEERIGISVFLVDVWAKGVVDCYYDEMPVAIFNQQMEEVSRRISPMKEVDAATFKHLVLAADKFAQSHQFAPHADYAIVKQIFANVDEKGVQQEYEFGKDGLPYVVKHGCQDTSCGHDHH